MSVLVRAVQLFVCCLACLWASRAPAGERIRIAAQKTGTLAWELDVIRAHGLAAAAGLDIVVTELASPEAGKIALKGGTADIAVTDWLWVARERSLGGRLVFHPYSSTLGAVMARPDRKIAVIADLKGRKLAVAGGPLDKSWLLLQGLARHSGLDLRREAEIVYGAPPLLSQKAVQGETDATLTYWNFAADLESKGLVRVIDMVDVQRALGAAGPAAIIGYAFDGQWAADNRRTVDRFLAVAQQAKERLAGTPAEWQRLVPRIGVADAAALDVIRTRYAQGVPRRPVADEERDARALFAVLAAVGGEALVGQAKALDDGLFWRPGQGD